MQTLIALAESALKQELPEGEREFRHIIEDLFQIAQPGGVKDAVGKGLWMRRRRLNAQS